MRDILSDLFENQPLDPAESVRRSTRGPTRKRFYKSVSVAEDAGGFAIRLDGKPVRTPARRLLAAPIAALADAIAAEWQAQDQQIVPSSMPLTRLANAIIDGVADAPAPVAAEIANYLGSDLICYRAGEPAGLVAAQSQHWDPLIGWARETLGARFLLAEGIVFAKQTPEALAAVTAAIPMHPWRLGAVSAATTLTGSALIALALAHGHIGLETAWAAAHVDEDWSAQTWGEDDLAAQRRAARLVDMAAAARVLDALR